MVGEPMVEAIRQGDIPGVQLRQRCALPQDVARAWRWLTEPAALERWAAARVELEPRAGGTLLLEGVGEAGEPRRERCLIQEWLPPRRLSLALERLGQGWPVPTTVTLELAERETGGAELSVLHQGFQQLPLSRCLTIWEEYRRRWRAALAALAVAAAASPP